MRSPIMFAFSAMMVMEVICGAGTVSVALAQDTYESGIEYAKPDGQALQLDLARPAEGEGPFPAVVCIHGGGFREGDLSEYGGLISALAERGYVAVTITYRLAPDHPFPAAVQDCKAAVRWLRANAKKYNIDPERIGVMGGSAGGTLAQFVAVTTDKKQFEGNGGNPDQSSRVQCFVSFFGPSDLTKSYDKSADAAYVLPLYLGGNLEEARPRHVEASPITWVTPKAPPALFIHGTNDEYVALEQSEWMVDRLKAAGVEASLLILDGQGHGFDEAGSEKADAALFAFFDEHLKKK